MKLLTTAEYARFAERPTTNRRHYQERITKPLKSCTSFRLILTSEPLAVVDSLLSTIAL